jgi:hypothetical protein
LKGKVFTAHGMKREKGRRVIYPLILNLDNRWRREWSASVTVALPPAKEVFGIERLGGRQFQ